MFLISVILYQDITEKPKKPVKKVTEGAGDPRIESISIYRKSRNTSGTCTAGAE